MASLYLNVDDSSHLSSAKSTLIAYKGNKRWDLVTTLQF